MNITLQKLFAGASWNWIEDLSDYPAPEYTLIFFLKLRNNQTIELTGIAEGSAHKFAVNSGTTNIPNGKYSYQAQAFKAGEMSLVETGSVDVLPNLAVAEDSREYWEQVVDEAKAAYKTLAGQVADQITLSNGKTITFANRKELLKIINNAEVKAGFRKSRRKTFAKFINP